MKHILFILILGFTVSCKAQTIVNLDGPLGANHYQKDLNNVRANFVGTWQYTNGSIEFLLHIYKIDMASQGNWWGQGEYWRDNIIGNYIYKENGVEIINTSDYLSSLININQTPFYGYTINGITTEELLTRIVDYGKPYLNYDCEEIHKQGEVQMEITNLNSGNPLEAIFKILPIAHTIHTSNPACNDTNDLTGFSLPTNMILTKISDTPPQLD